MNKIFSNAADFFLWSLQSKQIPLCTQCWYIWCLILLHCQTNYGSGNKSLICLRYQCSFFGLFFWVSPLYNEVSLVLSNQNNSMLLKLNSLMWKTYQGLVFKWARTRVVFKAAKQESAVGTARIPLPPSPTPGRNEIKSVVFCFFVFVHAS